MTTETNTTYCDGCTKHCEYDYFTRTNNGAIYPTIGTKIIQKYTDANNITKFIQSGDIRTKQDALSLAQKISMSCKHREQKTK